MKKRVLALLLSAVMVLGVVGCGAKDTTKESTAKPSTESAVKEESKTEESKAEVKEDPAELTLIMYGDMGERRESFFKNEFKQAVLEDLNIDVEVEFLTWGAVTGDVANRLMAGEKFAYMHIPAQTDQAQRGLCAEITQEDIDTYLTEYKAMRENKGFDCVKFDGKIVAVPMGNKASSGNYKSVTVLNNILNEVGWDYKDIKTYEQLIEAALAVKEKYPDMRIFRTADSVTQALDHLIAGDATVSTTASGMGGYIFMLEGEDGDQVYSTYESEAFEKKVKFAEELVELGLVKDDLLSDPSAASNDWNVGNCLLTDGVPGNMVEPGIKANMPEGTDLRIIQLDGYSHYYKSDFDWAFSISIAAEEDVPDYLRLFNWMYASEENYNFCIYGVEGKDWERNADGSINRLISEVMFDDWFLQASCYFTYDPSISEEAIAEYEAWDAEALKSKMAGFSFDSSNVSTEVAAMKAIQTEFIKPLLNGYGNYDEDMPAVIEKLKAAGLDKYLEEFRKQYSAWYAENVK